MILPASAAANNDSSFSRPVETTEATDATEEAATRAALLTGIFLFARTAAGAVAAGETAAVAAAAVEAAPTVGFLASIGPVGWGVLGSAAVAIAIGVALADNSKDKESETEKNATDEVKKPAPWINDPNAEPRAEPTSPPPSDRKPAQSPSMLLPNDRAKASDKKDDAPAAPPVDESAAADAIDESEAPADSIERRLDELLVKLRGMGTDPTELHMEAMDYTMRLMTTGLPGHVKAKLAVVREMLQLIGKLREGSNESERGEHSAWQAIGRSLTAYFCAATSFLRQGSDISPEPGHVFAKGAGVDVILQQTGWNAEQLHYFVRHEPWRFHGTQLDNPLERQAKLRFLMDHQQREAEDWVEERMTLLADACGGAPSQQQIVDALKLDIESIDSEMKNLQTFLAALRALEKRLPREASGMTQMPFASEIESAIWRLAEFRAIALNRIEPWRGEIMATNMKKFEEAISALLAGQQPQGLDALVDKAARMLADAIDSIKHLHPDDAHRFEIDSRCRQLVRFLLAATGQDPSQGAFGPAVDDWLPALLAGGASYDTSKLIRSQYHPVIAKLLQHLGVDIYWLETFLSKTLFNPKAHPISFDANDGLLVIETRRRLDLLSHIVGDAPRGDPRHRIAEDAKRADKLLERYVDAAFTDPSNRRNIN